MDASIHLKRANISLLYSISLFVFVDKEKRENKGEMRMILGARFPVERWTAAQEYFKIT